MLMGLVGIHALSTAILSMVLRINSRSMQECNGVTVIDVTKWNLKDKM